MPWLRLSRVLPPDAAGRLAERFEECGAASVTLDDAGDTPILATANEPHALWPETRVTALYPADTLLGDVLARLGSDAGTLDHDYLADADWGRVWMDRYQPLCFGARLWIVPSWLTSPNPSALSLILDPGLAFGTGTHATTALCLSWLAASDGCPARVLDYGCGSGILALAALRLGALHATGVDVDPEALRVAGENAARNGLERRLSLHAHGQLPTGNTWPLVIANILADPLIALAPALALRLAPGGTLLLSGMLANQMDEVAAAYPSLTFERRTQEDWGLMIGR